MSTEGRTFSRRQQSFSTVVTVQLASTLLLKGNPNRTAITISSHPTQKLTIKFGSAAVLDEGINIPPASQPLTIRELDHGDALRGEWFAITNVGAANFCVLETIVVNNEEIKRITSGSV